METQKIVNLLNNIDNENSKFATKKMVCYWQWLKRCLFTWKWNQIFNKFISRDYSDANILVTGNITVTGGHANTKVAFKNCAPFKNCRTEINDTFVEYTDFINTAMPMYNLIEYSDNDSDTSGSLWRFKRDEQPVNNNGTFIDITAENSSSFRYKSNLIGNTVVDGVNSKKRLK